MWIWAVLLVMLGISLAALELFIPSGGILAFLAICSIAGGVVLGFMDSPVFGLSLFTGVIIGVPIALGVALKWWPRTAIGQRVLLRVRSSEEVLPDTPQTRSLKSLVGCEGVAKSKMLPSGVISIEGRTIDAFSEGMPIEIGQRVVVIEVHGSQVTVRPVDDGEPTPTSDDALDQPINTIVPDPFHDSGA